jgi:dihydrofolate reductase
VKTKLTLIAALDENRLLANAQGIPWKLPRDVAHFRAYTQGKWLLLGRRTYEEMTGWFTDHTPLVLSSQCGYEPNIGRAVASVPQALALAQLAGESELICCGGAQVFATALPYADKLVLTKVHHDFPAGGKPVYFPEFNENEWKTIDSQEHTSDVDHAYAMSIMILKRRKS